MAVVKVYCSRCGQRVSGDESFFGTSVQCPVCSSQIQFPDSAPDNSAPAQHSPIPDPPGETIELPSAALESSPDSKESQATTAGKARQPAHTVPLPQHPNPHGHLPQAGSGFPDPPQSLPQGPGLPVGPLPGGMPDPPRETDSDQSGESRKSESEGSSSKGEDAGEQEDAGSMPLLVLGSGIASIVFCSGFLVLGAVAIVTGHLTMMKMEQSGSKEGRGKVLVGTLLGYCSVVLFLITMVGIKLAWPAIQKGMENGGAGAGLLFPG